MAQVFAAAANKLFKGAVMLTKHLGKLLLCLITTLGVRWWFGGCSLLAQAAPLSAGVADLAPTFRAQIEASASTKSSSLGASHAALVVNPDATQVILEKKNQDLTEVTSSKTVELATQLLEKPESDIKWYHFMQSWIRRAITNGLPSNLLTLLILFPIVATIIAFSRHVLGLRGFGIYAPATLAIAFLSTTITMGVIMFVFIVLATVISGRILRHLNLAHLPKSALTIWLVCVLVIALLLVMANLHVEEFYALTILPLLFLVSLAENFTSTQLMSSTREAVRLTVETIFLAVISTLIIGSNPIRVFVILNPELSLLAVFVLNLLIGRYTGLRLTELLRFKLLVKKK